MLNRISNWVVQALLQRDLRPAEAIPLYERTVADFARVERFAERSAE
jgi:hypothetical protein